MNQNTIIKADLGVKFDYERIMESVNLHELADNLEYFVEYAKTTPDKKTALSNLYKYIFTFKMHLEELDDYDDDEGYDPWMIFDSNLAVNIYLEFHWPYGKEVDKAIKRLDGLVHEIRDSIIIPQGTILSSIEIEQIMDFLETKYSFCSKLLSHMPLHIVSLEHSCKYCHSFYLSDISEHGFEKDILILTHTHDKYNMPQEYTLLHELGHLLHTRTMEKPDTVPASFKTVMEEVFIDEMNATPREIAEIFANSFAFAASKDSKYEHSDFGKALDDAQKDIVCTYFDDLMKSI